MVKLSVPDEFLDRFKAFKKAGDNYRAQFKSVKLRKITTAIKYWNGDFVLAEYERGRWAEVPTNDIKIHLISHVEGKSNLHSPERIKSYMTQEWRGG